MSSTAASDCELSVVPSTENSSESIKTPISSTLPKQKRTRTADSTWKHTWEPQGSETERAGSRNNLVYYCKYCDEPSYSTYVSTTFRNHLLRVHSIDVESTRTHPVKEARMSLPKDAFAKAGHADTTTLKSDDEQVLRNTLNQKAVIETLVQLVTVRNLPYNCSQWPELHALLMAVNPTAENVINLSHGSIQKPVSNSY